MDNDKDKSEKISADPNEVQSLHDVKDENGDGLFQVSTKFKFILSLSVVLFFLQSVLIYAAVEGALAAEMWQVAIWGLGGLIALYSVMKRSLAALFFNLVLFFGISLLPAWSSAFTILKPVIELFTGPLG